ncbi:MAG: metal ABC transporter permease [Oscillospiraceae bacterium]|nr:metal ABC transporter permease [Oscillospiraceae bacterium]
MDKLSYYLSFPFVWYALIVGVLTSLCASLLGVTLVMKRFSFIGDGLSHVAFGAMATAAVLNVTNDLLVIFPVTIIAAILLLKNGQNTKVKGDAAIGMISVSALAIGYLLMNIFPSSANVSGDVCTTLFGSSAMITLNMSDVIICLIMSAAVIVLYVMNYAKIFAVTFDESFSKAVGVKADRMNLIIAVVTAVVIVLAMRLVGSLLITALVIFPAMTAMRLYKSYFSVTVCACVISMVCALAGILVSLLAGTPTGATIAAANIAVYLAVTLIRRK